MGSFQRASSSALSLNKGSLRWKYLCLSQPVVEVVVVEEVVVVTVVEVVEVEVVVTVGVVVVDVVVVVV